MYVVISPLVLQRTKTKNFILNQNIFRNSHYRIMNNMKIKYKQVMKQQIQELPPMEKIEIIYTLYPKTKRKIDILNVTSAVGKFFEDALVEFKKIPDDDYHHLTQSTHRFGSIDKINPRVEIQIKELN